ncbi:MAG: preprotein translocase subunit SecY [Planctomycetota bacterium]
MFSTFENIFKIPELKKRILVTLGLLAVYRIGFSIPIPGVTFSRFVEGLVFAPGKAGEGGLFGIISQLGAITGGAWLSGSIFSLGIMPYISASIIFSLLQKIVPSLEQLAKEGEAGQQKLNQYARYVTVLLCLVQAVFIFQKLPAELLPVADRSVFSGMFLQFFIALAAGTMLIMWIGERITESGIGNGISMLIMAGIIARMPSAMGVIFNNYFSSSPLKGTPETGVLVVSGLVMAFVLIVMGVIVITQGTRKITIQQAKHVRGTRIYGGQRSYMPLRVNHAGVMPVIFASPVMMLVSTIFAQWLLGVGGGGVGNFFGRQLSNAGVLYTLMEVGLIFFFSYFWTALYFNPADTAKNIKEYGSFIPGIRPGKNTSDYMEKIMNRVIFGGAAFLAAIAILPMLLSSALEMDYIVVSFLGGTGILIVVGVALDLVQKVESHLVMRHYDGFMSGGKRIRGRRR